MTKIELPSSSGLANVEVARSTLEILVNRIEYLLEGRADIDNVAIADYGGDYALLSADTVQDMASTVRPFGSKKIIGSDSSVGISGINSSFNTLANLMVQSPNYIVLSKKETKSFVNEDEKDFPRSFRVTIPKSHDVKAVANTSGFPFPTEYDEYLLTVNAWISSNDTGQRLWYWEVTDVTEKTESIIVSFVKPSLLKKLLFISHTFTGSFFAGEILLLF